MNSIENARLPKFYFEVRILKTFKLSDTHDRTATQMNLVETRLHICTSGPDFSLILGMVNGNYYGNINSFRIKFDVE